MPFINMTEHAINVYAVVVDGNAKETNETEHVKTFPPSGTVIRVTEKRGYRFQVSGIDMYSIEYGESTHHLYPSLADGRPDFKQVPVSYAGLPELQTGTFLIVSAQVRLANPDRPDLVSPGELLRNDKGQPMGCIGFNINAQN